MKAPLEVGQRVVLRDANESRLGGPKYATVTKIARTLVTVTTEGKYPREEKYRLDSFRKNDSLGHGWMQTVDQYEQGKQMAVVRSLLREAGIDVRMGFTQAFTVDQLERILAIAQESKP